MIVFQYHPAILARFPTVVGGVILAQHMTNGPTPASLQAKYLAEQQATLQRIGTTPLSQIPALAAWRGAFRGFDVDPTQYRSAAEALLRRLTKKGDIPGINLLVDLGNLVSIRYALPVAVFDTRTLQGSVTVHFADGSERYTSLGESGIDHPLPGEVVFSDESKMVIARRVEAHHAAGHRAIAAALNDLLALLQEYTCGNFISAILDAEHLALIN